MTHPTALEDERRYLRSFGRRGTRRATGSVLAFRPGNRAPEPVQVKPEPVTTAGRQNAAGVYAYAVNILA